MKKTLVTLSLLSGFWLLSNACRAGGDNIRFSTKDGIPYPTITALACAQDWLWAGTRKGLAVKAATGKQFYAFPEAKEHIQAIIPEGDTARVVTGKGLFLANARDHAWKQLVLPSGIAPDSVRLLQTGANGRIWLGTETGLFQNLGSESGWKEIIFPKEMTGPIQSIACSGSLCFVGSGSAELAILDQDSLRWLTRVPCKETLAVTALAVVGSQIWVGTNGQGIYIYDWARNHWDHPDWNSALPGQIQAVLLNGMQFWFGTFSGLAQMKATERMPQAIDLGHPSSINCLAIGPEELYVGTEFGIGVLPLEQPTLAFQPRQSIGLSATEMDFAGTVHSQAPIKTLKVLFALASLPDVWFENNMELSSPNSQGQFHGRWLLADLPSPNQFYLLKAEAMDARGRMNSSTAPLLLALEPPRVVFNPMTEPINIGLQTISGKINTPFVSSLRLEPGGIQVVLDPRRKMFEGTMNLVAGNNTIRALSQDWFGQAVSAEMRVAAKEMVSDNVVRVEAGEKKGEEKILLSSALLFDTASISITRSGLEALEKVADYMSRDEAIQATIAGHTDNIPISTQQFPNNQILSKERAKAVFEYLIKTKKFSAVRFDIIGMGDAQPIGDNSSEEGRAKNRRVEIMLKKIAK